MRPVRITLDDLPERRAFLDPAGKRSAQQRARDCRPSINVIARDALDRRFWLYSWARKTNTRALIDHVFAVNDFWRPQVFGCESNAMQSLFADAIDIIAEHHQGRKLPLASVRQPHVIDKDFRIQCVMHPIVGEARLMVLLRPRSFMKGREWHPMIGVPEDCLAELTSFPMHPLKDVADGLASANALFAPILPRSDAARGAGQSAYEREMDQLHGVEGRVTPRGDDPFAEFRQV